MTAHLQSTCLIQRGSRGKRIIPKPLYQGKHALRLPRGHAKPCPALHLPSAFKNTCRPSKVSEPQC